MTTKTTWTTYAIDDECNAEYFWDCIRKSADHCPVPRFGKWLSSGVSVRIILDSDEAAVVSSWLSEQPGWTDSDYPEYAQHPLICEVDEVEVR